MVASWRKKIFPLGGWCLILLPLCVASINWLTFSVEATGGIANKRAVRLLQQRHQNPTNNLDLDSITSPQAPTSCDLLLSENIGAYCQCKDVETDISINSQDLATAALASGSSNNLWRINQLNCYPQNLTQIIEDLTHLMVRQNSNETQIQIDYFSINTNLTQGARLLSGNHPKRLFIDHISLQLTPLISIGDQSKTTDSSALSRSLEEQMIDFVRLINETHLQFLSIFLEDNNGSSNSNNNNNNKFEQHIPGNGNGTGGLRSNGNRSEIKFGRSLASLAGLSRLELSLGQNGASSLLLESETLREQAKLRWLNLASNAEIKFDRNIVRRSPFSYSPNLEYLSLESSNLESFPLFTLFNVPLPTEPLTAIGLNYYGLPKLTSLNLAGNKLASFEEDLFTQISKNEPQTEIACYKAKHDTNIQSHRVFYLPALTQLDLSHNQLRDMTLKTGQYILCSMPNLNQLYLQHNKIVHLNLNSLLTYPIDIPNSFQTPNETSMLHDNDDVWAHPTKSSQLEHIDLSHNHLIKITAFQWAGNTTSQTRVKSINLSSNKLQHSITPLNPKLVNKLIFKESFDFIDGSKQTEILNLNNLESLLALASIGADNTIASICDFLSPASSGLQTTGGDLLNEILFTNNELSQIESNYFLSKQCRDVQILRLSRNRIESLAGDAFLELPNLEQLDLSYNMISHLNEETFFKNIRLRLLDLSHNRLSSIKKNLFLQITELESLSLSDNQLFELPNELFAYNNQLEIVDLSNNKLSHLDNLLFFNSKYLRLLNLRGNQLRKLIHQAFELSGGSGIHRVGSVSLANTLPITSLRPLAASKKFGSSKVPKSANRRHNRQAVEGANVLVLTLNQIDSIQFEKCVQFGQNIQLLWLDNNRLKELHDTSFKCFRSVQRLYLNSNRIRFIGDSTFQHLAQLEYLDLSKNLLSQVKADSLVFPSALSYLDLSANHLVSFRFVDSFVVAKDTNNSGEMTQIERINLGENLDLTLDTSDLITFMNRVDLRQIDLGNIERVKFMTKDANITLLRDKSYLQTLNFSSINYIDDLFLTALGSPSVSLERIDLSFTVLSLLSNNRLLNFLTNKLSNGLVELNIGGNQYGNNEISRLLSNLEAPIQLQILNLSNNIMEHWPFSNKIAPKLIKLQSLDLSRNKLRYFMKDEINNYTFAKLEILNLSSNALVSLTDHSKHRKISLKNLTPRIKHLDLSHNRLSWIPLQFLDDLDQLNWLRLDNNQLETLSPVCASQSLMLDLSFNQKLRAIGGGNEIDFQLEAMDFADVIIFADHTEWKPQLKCQSIDDYLDSQKEEKVETTSIQGAIFVEWNALKDDERLDNDKCPGLIQMIDSIRLDSISALINLNSIRGKTNKFLHLSLRRNGLNRIETSDRNNDIVQLDLSENKIQDLPGVLCRDLLELQSLDLSNNQIDAIPYDVILSCSMLSYLDLSHNKIVSFTKISNSGSESSNLLVLKLSNNMFKDLSNINLNIFESLRFLDLRFNQLKSNSHIPNLKNSHLLTTLPNIERPHSHSSKMHLKLTDTSLLINDIKKTNTNLEWDTISVQKIGPGGDINNSLIYDLESSTHLISFCTLNLNNDIIKVCLSTKVPSDEEGRCFFFKTPKNVPSCLTNLHEPESDTIDQNLTITNSSLRSFRYGESGLDTKIEVDPVVSFIDSLKKNWLKLREVNVNEYLASITNVGGNSIWTTLDGKYAIYTLTLVKISIVGGSICIVILLILVFALLTCRTSDDKHSSPKSNSSSNNVTNTDTDITDSSMTNNSESNNLPSQIHQSSSPSGPCSSSRSKSTSDNDDTQKNTVVETKTIHQLDPHQLMLQQQACATPCSSLAPSSVETAETLQAVDSIKSGTPVQLLGGPNRCSVDQYAEIPNNSNNLHQPCQVATVMRMVKSSSANFNPNNRNQTEVYKNTYGTLNNRHPNYMAQKSKLRSIYENQHQRCQIYPANIDLQQSQPLEVNQYASSGHNTYNYVTTPYLPLAADDSLQQYQDPTTKSLLSINSALSANHNIGLANNQFSQDANQVQPPNLCQYHRLVHESSEGSSMILEQQEEEQYHNNDLGIMNNLPPPPSSRVIEALENSIYYMSNGSRGPHFTLD